MKKGKIGGSVCFLFFLFILFSAAQLFCLGFEDFILTLLWVLYSQDGKSIILSYVLNTMGNRKAAFARRRAALI